MQKYGGAKHFIMGLRIRKTAIIILLITAYFLSAVATTAYAKSFPDVSKNHKNYLAVTKLTEQGVITGYDDGSFCPEREITRTEFCALMARTLGCDKNTYVFEAIPFTDVKPAYWGEWCISYCYEKKLINGMGNGEFWPAAMVTMEQAVKMAVCAIGKEAEAQEIIGEAWYDGYIETAEKYNLFYKVDGEIGKPAVRSDIAQIVYNMLETDLVASDEDNPLEEEQPSDTDEENSEDEANPTEEPEEEDTISAEILAAYREKDFLDIKTILIDAGHNYAGRDTGAENKALDIKEEVITWQIADKLRNRLEELGYNVVMTRDKLTDSIANTSVVDSLQARVDLGHQVLADLFISIHCNAGGGSGTEVYCFTENGYAGRLAKIVQKNIVAQSGLYNRGVKTANFFVIQNTLMPAILIETGFIDHQKDAEILSSEEGQSTIANAVADAVSEYDHMKITDFVQTSAEGLTDAVVPNEEITNETTNEIADETTDETEDNVRGIEDEE